MAKQGVTLDTVMINIETNAGSSYANIDKLSASLNTLKSAISGGFANVNKLANGLANLKEASKGLSEIGQNLEPLTNISNALKPLSEIKATGFNKIINSLERIPEAMGKITPSALENVSRVSGELSNALSPLASKLESISQGYSAISKLADKYGVSVTKVRDKSQSAASVTNKLKSALSKLASPFRKLKDSSSDFGKTATKQFTKLNSKIKQVALSLIGTRTIFTMVRKAVSEYMQLDEELSKFSTNVWRALGAQLAPVIEYTMELFKQFIRVIYSFVYAITGIDLIARANEKAMKGWGKSAKDLLGNLQKFDDLNVVDFSKSSGGDNQLIELDKIDLSPIQKIIDLVKKLKDEIKNAFNTGEWKGVGEAIANIINYTLSKIKVANIKKFIQKVTKPLVSSLNGIIENLNWSDLGESISNIYTSIIYSLSDMFRNINYSSLTQGVLDALTGVNFPEIVRTWTDLFKTFAVSLNDIVFTLNLNWDAIKSQANEFGLELANLLNNTIKTINWVELTTSIIEGINTLIESAFTFITTFDWSQLGETLASIVNTTFETFDFDKLADSITQLLHGLLTSLTKFVKDVNWYEVGEKIVKLILDVDWAQLAVDLLDFTQNLWSGMLDAAAGAGASLRQWLESLFSGKNKAEEDARSFGQTIGDMILMGNTEALLYEAEHPNDGIGKAIARLKGMIKGLFGIHSPSKWAKEEIGENIAQGMANGLSSLWSKCKGYFTSFVNGVIEIINKMIRSINNKLKISIGSTLSSILQGLGVNVQGGYYQLFSIPEIPKLETGTNRVPREGLYHLHTDEAVVPKKYNPAIGGGYSDELVIKLDKLINLVENQEQTTIVNVGNETLYKKQEAYNRLQNNKYGTVNI